MCSPILSYPLLAKFEVMALQYDQHLRRLTLKKKQLINSFDMPAPIALSLLDCPPKSMSLAEILQSKIDHARPRIFETPADVVNLLRAAAVASASDPATTSIATSPEVGTSTSTKPNAAKGIPTIGLDMFIAFREEFYGGWILWLGTDEILKLTPDQKKQFAAMTFDEKASHFFRLTVWTKSKKREADAKAITEIPDGSEIFVERVTGLLLFEGKMAQGNASRVEEVAMVDDCDIDNATPGSTASDSQSTDGNRTDHESPALTEKRAHASKKAKTA